MTALYLLSGCFDDNFKQRSWIERKASRKLGEKYKWMDGNKNYRQVCSEQSKELYMQLFGSSVISAYYCMLSLCTRSWHPVMNKAKENKNSRKLTFGINNHKLAFITPNISNTITSSGGKRVDWTVRHVYHSWPFSKFPYLIPTSQWK